jgi:hypothetical protein
MPATPVPKLTTTLVLPWEANCSTIFSASLLLIFSDEFKFTYKTVSLTNQTSCSGSFSHDALKGFCFVWFKSFGSACRNDGLRQGCSEKFQFRRYRLAVLGGWFRLGEKSETFGIHGSGLCLKLSL